MNLSTQIENCEHKQFKLKMYKYTNLCKRKTIDDFPHWSRNTETPRQYSQKDPLLNVLSKQKQAEKYKCIWLLHMNEESSFSKILRNHLSPFWHTNIISVSFENFSSTCCTKFLPVSSTISLNHSVRIRIDSSTSVDVNRTY